MHRGAFCQFPFRSVYYCHSSKSNGKETGKTHLCAMGWKTIWRRFNEFKHLFFKRYLRTILTAIGRRKSKNISSSFKNHFAPFQLDFSIAKLVKVRTFWEAHKNLRNLSYALYIHLVNIKTIRKCFFKFCLLLRKSKL